MSDYPKQMLFITALSGSGRLILVEVIGPNPRINGGLYIRYPEGGTDTTYPEFLFDVPEEITRLQSEVERLRWRCGELEDECRNAQKYMVWLSGGKEVPTVRAWLLRKQAEAVEACADGLPKIHATFVRLHNEAQHLRQQADEAEKAGD